MILKTKIVGTQHSPGGQTCLNSLKNGHQVILKREPANRFDRAAISVWLGVVRLGYIPKTDNRNLAIALDQGISAGAFMSIIVPSVRVALNCTEGTVVITVMSNSRSKRS